MFRMERDEPQKVSVANCYRANALTESQRINSAAVARFEMFDGLPSKPGVAIKRGPFELAQPTQAVYDLP